MSKPIDPIARMMAYTLRMRISSSYRTLWTDIPVPSRVQAADALIEPDHPQREAVLDLIRKELV